MNKQNLLSITLIVTGLALNPAVAETVEARVAFKVPVVQSVASEVSELLYARGLDKNAAELMAANVVGEDEMPLAMLIHNLEMQNIATKDEVLAYLSKAALHKQKLEVHSYDQLLGMVSTIKQKSLDKSTRKQLSQIVKINRELCV